MKILVWAPVLSKGGGNGLFRSLLSSLARNANVEKITFATSVRFGKLSIEIFRNSGVDVFVFPSTNTEFGLLLDYRQEIIIPAAFFKSDTGEINRINGSICAKQGLHKAGFIALYYGSLPKGRYRFSLSYSTDAVDRNKAVVGIWGIAYWDNNSFNVLSEQALKLSADRICTVYKNIEITETISGKTLEYRVHYSGLSDITVYDMRISRISNEISEGVSVSPLDAEIMKQLSLNYMEAERLRHPLSYLSSQHDIVYFIWPHNIEFEKVDKPSVLSFVDTITLDYPPEGISGHHLSEYWRTSKKWFESVTRIIVPSNYVKDRLIAYFGAICKSSVVVTHRLPPERSLETTGRNIRGNLPKDYLIYPANTSLHKNHENLLIAYARYKHRKALPLVLIGEHTDSLKRSSPQWPEIGARFVSIIKKLNLKIDKDIYPLGFVNNSEAYELIKNAKGLIMASKEEGGGSFPIEEALSLGVPVICSDIPVMREHLSDYNIKTIWFDPYSPESIVEAIHRFEKKYKFLKASALKFKEEHVSSWDNVATKYIAIFKEAIEIHRTGESPYPERLKTLGVWQGFDHPLSIKREGIGRFMTYMLKHLVKNYPVNLEMWCYSYNYKEIQEIVNDIDGGGYYKGRIKIFTEKSFNSEKNPKIALLGHGFGIVSRIVAYRGSISWKEPYRIYKTHYNLKLTERKKRQGSTFSMMNYYFNLPIDVLFSAFLIAAGITAKILSKTVLKIVKGLPMVDFFHANASELSGNVGRNVDIYRTAEQGMDKKDYLIYGPYLKLPQGYYEFTLDYTADKDAGEWDIAFDYGRIVSKKGILKPKAGNLKQYIWIDEYHSGLPIEFRVWYSGKGRLTVSAITIKRAKTPDVAPLNTLAAIANKYSKADIFFINIVTMKNGLELSFPKVVELHDLVTLEFYDYFVSQDPNLKAWIEEGRLLAETYASQGAFFCGISNYVIQNQLFKYIKGAREENTDFIYHAGMLPDDILSKLQTRETILNKYTITGRYIFYPTQIRPYKNLITLLKALNILKSRGFHINLVLTADFTYDSKSHSYAIEHALLQDIVFCGTLSESDLYSLYKYAEAVVCSSLFEGGFPLQALEGMHMETPVIIAKIPVTIERLKHECLNPYTCGLKLFEPENDIELAEKLSEVINNRDKAVLEQKAAREKILSYTWDDASRKYYRFFSKILNRERLYKPQNI